MSNSLTIIPSAIESAVKPKPTRNEIITAMAAIHINQCSERQKESSAKKKALGEKIKTMMVAAIRKDGMKTLQSSANFGYKSGSTVYGGALNVSFDESLHPGIKAAMLEYHNIDREALPTIQEARKLIRERLEARGDGETRIKALLDNEDSRRALEKALKQII